MARKQIELQRAQIMTAAGAPLVTDWRGNKVDLAQQSKSGSADGTKS